MSASFHFFVVAAAIVLVAVSFFAYRGTTPALSRRLRVFLSCFRVASFLALLFLMMDPRYVLRSEKAEPANIVALVDRSESMTLAAEGGGTKSRFDAAREIADRVEAAVKAKGASYDEAYFSAGELAAPSDSVSPSGQGTDIRGALDEAFEKFEGKNVTGFVLISDGVDTGPKIVRKAIPPVPVFAVGLGDTIAAEDVRIKDVDYSSVVRVPSRSTLRATLEYSFDASHEPEKPKRVRVRLKESDRTVFERDTLFARSQRELVQDIPVEFRQPGERRFTLEVAPQGFDAEDDNNRREIVVDAEKSGEKILIVDLMPSWELHFLTGYLRKDPSFDFDVVSSVGSGATAKTGKVVAQADFARRLDEYDALVLASLDGNFPGDADVAAINSFVRDKRRGLLVLAGTGSLYEQARAWSRLGGLLPVQAGATPRFNLRYTTVRPGPHAALHPITSQLVPQLSRSDWQQRSPLLGFYSPLAPKPGAEILLETDASRAPAMVCDESSGGRVMIVAAGPLWRWKFLSDESSVYDELVSRTLDYLARGRSTERFVLRSAKKVYDSGETASLTAEIFNEKMQPITGVPVRVEISRAGEGSDIPLNVVSMQRTGSDEPRFKATLPPMGPGKYHLKGEADLGDRKVESKPIDITVSDVSVEFQRVSQDRANLGSIARQSGGAYTGGDGIDGVIERINLTPRVSQTTTEMSLRTSFAAFLVILGILSVEWIVRKRAGMI
jgi:hypothetical protein